IDVRAVFIQRRGEQQAERAAERAAVAELQRLQVVRERLRVFEDDPGAGDRPACVVPAAGSAAGQAADPAGPRQRPEAPRTVPADPALGGAAARGAKLRDPQQPEERRPVASCRQVDTSRAGSDTAKPFMGGANGASDECPPPSRKWKCFSWAACRSMPRGARTVLPPTSRPCSICL